MTEPTMDEALNMRGQPVFAHKFRSGSNKRDDERCACGQVTWREAVDYWRRAPRWQVLRRDVTWCVE